MHVNIPQARTALMRENVALTETINREGASTSAFDQFVGDEALQGEFYNAAKKYIQFVAKPLYRKFIEAAKEKVQANMHYVDELSRLSAYGQAIDLEKLLQQRAQLRVKINALKEFSDKNPICFLAGYSTLDKLYNISIHLEEAIAACYRFQVNTEGCYDRFNSCADEVSIGLAAAKSVCGVKGGMCTFGNAAMRNWAKLSHQELELCPNYCPDYASWDKMGEEAKGTIGPPPGSPGYVEDNFERSPAQNGGWARVCTWNVPGELACTFYTLRKLRERGLGYPFLHAGTNGNQWFENCDGSVPEAGGLRCVETLFSQYGELTNVVVCFPTNPDPTGQLGRVGHVVLIDRVYRSPQDGMLHVVFDDHRNYSTPDGTWPAEDITYDDFLARYQSWGNGTPTGARYIGGPAERNPA